MATAPAPMSRKRAQAVVAAAVTADLTLAEFELAGRRLAASAVLIPGGRVVLMVKPDITGQTRESALDRLRAAACRFLETGDPNPEWSFAGDTWQLHLLARPIDDCGVR